MQDKKGKVVPVLKTKYHAMKKYWGSGGIHNINVAEFK
jgi:hypothetical protein